MSPTDFLKAALVAVVTVSTACASGPSPATSQGGDRNVITRADLAASNDRNAFEAVRRLRPAWLRYRGQSVLTGPDREGLRVYLNGVFFGEAETLGSIQITDVEEIRFLDAREATLRYGTGHTVGAIVVSTLRRPAPPGG